MTSSHKSRWRPSFLYQLGRSYRLVTPTRVRKISGSPACNPANGFVSLIAQKNRNSFAHLVMTAHKDKILKIRK